MRFQSSILLAACFVLAFSGPLRAQEDLNDLLEKATKDAVKKVSPAVVQIVTQGGADMVVTTPKGPVFRKGQGPTTGVIVSADGYIISSAFNFINNPATILVSVQGHDEPYVAQRVANDKSRLLTLLKIDAKGSLMVPEAVPLKDMSEGQLSIALGRSLETKRAQPPSVSVGIISAMGRIWGKALQTDAKISPVNYGGPIIDVAGRIQGILVPASPKGEDETAGFEWYDSGIGFAIPFEDVLSVLPKLKLGKDLKKGLLGVRVKSQDVYGAIPEIADVVKDTAAARVGLKSGDVILEVEGKTVVNMAQIQHILGRKYEGDKITLKYRRGKDETLIKDLELVGNVQVAANPFLGILPLRDDPKLGVEVRYVYPKSPADTAGVKPGDRIVKFGAAKALQDFNGQKRGRDQLFDWLNTQTPGTEVELEVKRKDGKNDKVTLTLAALPGTLADDTMPDKLPETASVKKALEPLENTVGVKPPKMDPVEKKIETGLLKRNTPDGEHKYYVFVHEDYDPNVAHALVLWLHPPGKNKEADIESLTELWSDFCRDNHVIIVAPLSENESGWSPTESDFVVPAVREVFNRYTIDRQRVVAHGMGVAGQMAIYLGFQNRDLFRGVATTGAVIQQTKELVPTQRLSFWLAGGELDPLVKTIAESKTKLMEKRFPVVYRPIANRGREYLEEGLVRELARWIDALDRQ